MTRLSIVLTAALLVLAVASCGSGSETTTITGSTEATTAGKSAERQGSAPKASSRNAGAKAKQRSAQAKPESKKAAQFKPPVHHDSGGGSGQFEEKGGDNSIQRYGAEASGSEFDQAAAALHAYLDARAAGAWAAACSYMVKGVSEQLSQISGGGKGGGPAPSCAKILASLSAGLPPAALREVAVADVGALRTEGERGFILFRGAQGVDYFMPMAREGGDWKVAALAPSALP